MENFISKIVSLDNIRQWEERDSVIKESVSQHSFKVSAICVYLLEKIASINKVKADSSYQWLLFVNKCMKYAILHDFDESILGRDISHVVKYNSYNGEQIRGILDDFVDNKLKELDLTFVREDDSDVKAFVKLCDWLSMLTFIIRNKNAGSTSFERERAYCQESISKSVGTVIEMLSSKGYEIERTIFSDLISSIYGNRS